MHAAILQVALVRFAVSDWVLYWLSYEHCSGLDRVMRCQASARPTTRPLDPESAGDKETEGRAEKFTIIAFYFRVYFTLLLRLISS